MEKAIQYNRISTRRPDRFKVQQGRPDWNPCVPPIGEIYVDAMKRAAITPDKAREMYKEIPVGSVCPVGAGGMFTFIRHDGKTQMCACVADRRITVGDYLDTTTEQMIGERAGHAICQQCQKYRSNLDFHIVGQETWRPPL